MSRCAVVIPVYGRHELTHALLGDIAREASLADVIVVDNGGDYPPVGGERVLVQQQNLGWLRGCNTGVRVALEGPADHVVLLNNDTRLSHGFFAGLMAAARRDRVGVVGPRYDDHWAHQHLELDGPPASYQPKPRDRRALFVDGTCMLLRREVLETVGLLDEESFGTTGWGADIDLAYRARRAGWRVVVTDRAYLSHDAGSTARGTHGSGDTYWERGDRDLRHGLETKWGPDWSWACGLTGRGPRAWARHLIPGRG